MDKPLDEIIKQDWEHRKKGKKVLKKKGASGFKRDRGDNKKRPKDQKWKLYVEKNSRQSGNQKPENPARDPKNLRVTGLGTHIKSGEIRQLFE